MGVLNKTQITNRIINDDLIVNAQQEDNVSVPNVETSSYDLCVGSIVWKDGHSNNVKKLHYDEWVYIDQQKHVSLQPGQMMFIITKEEINMPLDLSATVFSRNKLSRDGILALNAGHIDPGFRGPITIRLINLRATPFTIKLGVPIYTIVFQTLDEPIAEFDRHPPITREATIQKITESVDEALSNALFDLALLNNFVKKEDFGSAYLSWMKKSIIGILTAIFGLIGVYVAINELLQISGVKDWLKKIVGNLL